MSDRSYATPLGPAFGEFEPNPTLNAIADRVSETVRRVLAVPDEERWTVGSGVLSAGNIHIERQVWPNHDKRAIGAALAGVGAVHETTRVWLYPKRRRAGHNPSTLITDITDHGFGALKAYGQVIDPRDDNHPQWGLLLHQYGPDIGLGTWAEGLGGRRSGVSVESIVRHMGLHADRLLSAATRAAAQESATESRISTWRGRLPGIFRQP